MLRTDALAALEGLLELQRDWDRAARSSIKSLAHLYRPTDPSPRCADSIGKPSFQAS